MTQTDIRQDFSTMKTVSGNNLCISFIIGILLAVVFVAIFRFWFGKRVEIMFIPQGLSFLIISCFLLRKVGENLFLSENCISKIYFQKLFKWVFIYTTILSSLTFFGYITTEYSYTSKLLQFISKILMVIFKGDTNTKELAEALIKNPFLLLFFYFFLGIIGPFAEEVFFRRFLYVRLRQKGNFWYAGLISSIIFTIAHVPSLFIFLTSLFLTYVYEKERSILINIGLHGSINIVILTGNAILFR